MGFSTFLSLFLFRGLFTSYFLLFAFEMQQHQPKFVSIITDNLRSYAHHLSLSLPESLDSQVASLLPYYCQFLVLVSITIFCGMRFGKWIGWMTAAANLGLLWSQVEVLFLGISH